tara:strand:+ start:244 stop:522 length:279 start_codon:yes stop_codon:yes gene_type:complete
MKLFEIEVVRTYTTTIEVALPDELTTSSVERIIKFPRTIGTFENDLYHEIWGILGEAELEQCETETLSVKAKELYHEEFKSFNEAPYGQDDE